RRMLWDEENRLLAISDNGYVSNYYYDASGERTVKLSGDNLGVFINGKLSGANTGTTKFTAYINPYMVVNNGGYYTKHYYIGSQRIASKLGDSNIFQSSPLTRTPLQTKLEDQTLRIKNRYDSLGVTYNGTPQGSIGFVTSANGQIPTPELYYYHSDHLGSSSLITNSNGDLVQHLEYVPFGETFIDERKGTWHTPFTFNAKEQDEETGLHYYGARYYDSKTGVWLSVDPLWEKYPNVSSYVYVNNNPLRFIDPNGLEKIIALNSNDSRNTKIINSANNYPENDPVIHIWAHGSPTNINIPQGNTETPIYNEDQLNGYLSNVSQVWQEKEENSFSIIVFHCCETGKGEDNFAQKISESEKFKNVLIVAPNENVAVSDQNEVEIGVFTSHKENVNGEMKDVKGDKGAWIFYLNGNKVNSMEGDSKPIFSDINQNMRKYESNIE
ncbi:MAG: RHS repeat domain-containing protein, partial [Nitrosarchaeum sp.]